CEMFKPRCSSHLALAGPDSYIPNAINTLQQALQQLSTALSSLDSVADEASAFAFVGGLCTVVAGLVYRLGPHAAPFADTIFDLTCSKLMAGPVILDNDVRTEAFTCLQTLIEGTSFPASHAIAYSSPVGGAGTAKYLP